MHWFYVSNCKGQLGLTTLIKPTMTSWSDKAFDGWDNLLASTSRVESRSLEQVSEAIPVFHIGFYAAVLAQCTNGAGYFAYSVQGLSRPNEQRRSVLPR
jgi:hypothetical protein